MKIVSADDRFAILDLFAEYSWAYDVGDAESYADTFTSDAVLADDAGLKAEGRAAIMEAVRYFFDIRGTNIWQHHNDHLRMFGDEHRCTVFSYWAVLEQSRETASRQIVSLGWYESECVKVAGNWRFARRTFHNGMPPSLPWAP